MNMTLDDLECPMRTLLQKRCVFRNPTTKIWMKIDPYYSQQNCRPMTPVSGLIRFMRTFAKVRSLECRGRQTTVGLSTAAIFPGYFFGNYRPRDEASVITWRIWRYAVHRRLFRISVIPKCMSSNGYFALNSVFAMVWLVSDRATFEK